MIRWLQGLFRASAVDKKLDAELRFHLEQQTEEYIAEGHKPARGASPGADRNGRRN